MSASDVARGGLFLFIGSLVGSVFGYAYWILVSIYGGSQVVGIAGSVYSLSLLISGIASLGVPVGVQRFLGRAYRYKEARRLNTYFWSSLVFTVLLCLLGAIALWTMVFLNIYLIDFSASMLILASFIILLSFSGITDALFFSIIRTQYTVISYVILVVTKLAVGVSLVYLGGGWMGAVIGIIFSSLSSVACAFYFALRELRRLGSADLSLSLKALRETVHAGLASWLPGIVTLLGQQLSLLTVYGFQGSSEAGQYFIASLIFGIVYVLPSSFLSVLFPTLSGLPDAGRNAAMRPIRLCLALVCPLTAFLILYPGFALSLIGGVYVQAAPILSLLMSSTIPLTFTAVVIALVYASGSYLSVLGIGLATNVPRVMLYVPFVTMFGGLGAALSFSIGAMTGLIAAVCVSYKASFRISLRKITVAVTAPFVAVLPCYLLGLNWVISAITITLVSVFCYGRLGVVERNDLAEIGRAFASEKTVAKTGERFNWLLRIIYGE